MNGERPAKRVCRAKIQKNKMKGRPRKPRDKVIEEILYKRDMNWTQTAELSQNR